MPTIPDIWPTPNNPATRVRVFRIEIERPLVGGLTATFHTSEAIEAGTSSFEKHRPELSPSESLESLLADPELGSVVAQVASGIEQISYALYLRNKALIEGGA